MAPGTCRVVEAPWRLPNANPSDFFNYGLTERTWRDYCKKVEQYRWVPAVQYSAVQCRFMPILCLQLQVSPASLCVMA